MPLWVQLVAMIAAVKSGVAVALALVPGALSSPVRPLMYSVSEYAVLILAFSAAGLTLILARTKDVRAVWLGSLLLVSATPFADTLFRCCTRSAALPVSTLLAHAQVVALLPL